jgi:hypothetical protein
VNTSETGDDVVVADDVSPSEPHAASVRTSDAAQATTATEDTREAITVVTLLAPHAVLVGSPAAPTIGARCVAALASLA